MLYVRIKYFLKNKKFVHLSNSKRKQRQKSYLSVTAESWPGKMQSPFLVDKWWGENDAQNRSLEA